VNVANFLVVAHFAQIRVLPTDGGCIDFGELHWTPTRFGEIDLCTFRTRQKYRGGPHLMQLRQ